MAHPTLPVLNRPEFPQVFSHAIDRQIQQIESIVLLITIAPYRLPTCDWCDEEFSCHSRATIGDIETGLEYCRAHFREVTRG